VTDTTNPDYREAAAAATTAPPVTSRPLNDPGVCEHGVTTGAGCRHCSAGIAKELHRANDGATSRAAAQSVAHQVARMQQRVFSALRVRGQMTHSTLCQVVIDEDSAAGLLPPTEQAIRTACARLVESGAVRDSARRERTQRGRLAVVWEAVL